MSGKTLLMITELAKTIATQPGKKLWVIAANKGSARTIHCMLLQELLYVWSVEPEAFLQHSLMEIRFPNGTQVTISTTQDLEHRMCGWTGESWVHQNMLRKQDPIFQQVYSRSQDGLVTYDEEELW